MSHATREAWEQSELPFYEQFEHRAEDPRVNCCDHPEHHLTLAIALRPCTACGKTQDEPNPQPF